MNGKTTRIVTVAALLCGLWACEQRTVEPSEEVVSSPHEASAAENGDATRAAFFDAIVQQAVELETRTFTLNEGVRPLEAANIIDAYVFRDRPNKPGMISADRNMLSVRETADNLDRIGRVIDALNAGATTPATETTLHFQLVEANGASETDPSIAVVERQLRQVLRFDGYRLLDEAFVTTKSGQIDVPLEASDGRSYKVAGVFRHGSSRSGPNLNVVDPGRELSVWLSARGTELLRSTVNIRHGQTIVLGSARAPGVRLGGKGEEGEYRRGPHLILILRATAATPDDTA